uniref:Transcription factor GTE9 n=1 Tax=Anthurium amnicola TaxID=1678845 RepID=A0A1D1YLA4_9ARAE
MTGSDGPDEEIWGTREELLLACAVSRHGTQSWESVATEVQSRSPSSPHLITPQTCRRRYHDLQRRFPSESRGIDGGDARGGPESAAISLLEELRRLRVAELRREVERYDVSIVSLQLKVKRLTEDRERSLQEERSGDEPDPPDAEGVEKEAESPPCSPGNLALDRVSDGDPGRSCSESNSTGPKPSRDPGDAEDGKLGAGKGAAGMDPVTGFDEKLAGEGSYNGSSDTVAKGTEAATPADDPGAKNPARRVDAGESGESVAESKGEASKESSDVQSSASPSRRRGGGRRKAAASGGSSGGDEAELDEFSPGGERDVAKSQPLASLLRIIRSREYGSVFERRLESQESARYRSLIRQHMDLATVQSKMDEGAYACDAEFYRDLLLLCTNAVVFFPKTSSEHTAGSQLRQLVRKQIPTTLQKPPVAPPPAAEEPAAPPPLPPPSVAPQPVATKAKTEPDLSGSLLDKPISAPPLVACRKRSSISGKPAARAQAAAKEEEKPDLDKEEVENAEKKRTKERSAVVGVRGLRTTKGRGSVSGGANRYAAPNAVPSSTESAAPSRMERRGNNGNAANPATASVAKKRSAVNFLTRMNRGTASSNGTLLETLKRSGGGGGKGAGGGGDQRKGGRTVAGKDQGPKQRSGAAGSSGKQVAVQSPPVKRSVGRPPKRPLPPLPLPPAKRAKEAVASVAATAKRRGRR